MDRFEVFLSNYPAGNSYQNLVMLAQNTVKDDFRQFNYGEKDNLAIYGSIEPPRIPLSKLNVPVALVQGSSDRLADETDVEWLYQQIAKKVVFRETFALGHMSFSLAKDMEWFSKDVLELLAKYATNTY